MLLYDVPREIQIEDVRGVIVKNYPSSTPFEKIQYTYWLHISECLSAGGKLCPTLNSFLKHVKVMDYLYALSTLLITVPEIEDKEEAIKIVLKHYDEDKRQNRVKRGNVIHVDFSKRGV